MDFTKKIELGTKIDWSLISPNAFPIRPGTKYIHNWFSNIEYYPITIDGFTWPSSENYYHAMRCNNPVERTKFQSVKPFHAKVMSRTVEQLPIWNEIKDDVMRTAIHHKVMQHGSFREKLLDTGTSILVEWNNWGDVYWGVDVRKMKGKNKLGFMLMEIRDKLLLEGQTVNSVHLSLLDIIKQQ